MAKTKPSHKDLLDIGTQTHAELETSIGDLESAITTLGGGNVGIKIMEIGPWNMDSTGETDVAHGLDATKIRSALIEIISDAGVTYSLTYDASASVNSAYRRDDATNITIVRGAGGFFDSTAFDDAVINRGWVTIFYTI